MNKKLLTLAVAAALAAPAIANAEAIMYGKLNVSLDYETIDNVIPPVFNNTANLIYQVGPTGESSFFGVAGVTPITSETVANLAAQGITLIGPGQTRSGQDFQGWGMSRNPGFQGESRASRLGVKGSEDLGNGLKAIYQIELGINVDDANSNPVNNNDTVTYRNTFVGLAGDWGTILMGRHDTPLKISTAKLDLFSDTMADYNGTVGFQDLRVDNAIAYISPSWSGFTLAVATVPAGGGQAVVTDTRTFTNINSDQINGAWSVAGIYSNGPFYASAAYESINEEMFRDTAGSLTPCNPVTFGNVTALNCNSFSGSLDKYRFGLGLLNWNGFSLTGIYEHQDLPTAANQLTVGGDPGLSWNLPVGLGNAVYPSAGGADSRDLWQIQAGYSFGNFMFKGMYGQTSADGSYYLPYTLVQGPNAFMLNNYADSYYKNNTESWALGVDYNFSKRTTLYALYTATTSDANNLPVLTAGGSFVPRTNQSDWDGFSIGLMHSF